MIRPHRCRLFEVFLGIGAVLLEHRGPPADHPSVAGRIVHHVSEAQGDVEGARGDFHRHRPLHAHSHRAVVAELADGGDPCPRPRAALGGGAREPARLSVAPQLLQPSHFPGGLGIGARLEQVHARSRYGDVVTDLVADGIEVVVDGDDLPGLDVGVALLAVLPLPEDRHLGPLAGIGLAPDESAGFGIPLAEQVGSRLALSGIDDRRPPAGERVAQKLAAGKPGHLEEERRQRLGHAAAHRSSRATRDRPCDVPGRHVGGEVREISEVERTRHQAAFLRDSSALATISCISATRASHPSLLTCAARTSLGPGPAEMAAEISRTTESKSTPMRQTESRSTSGMAVLTTGRPAARYSRTLSGLEARVSSLTLKGMSATSKALA